MGTYRTRRDIEEANQNAALNWRVVALRTGAYGFEVHTHREIANRLMMRPSEVRERFRKGMEAQGRWHQKGEARKRREEKHRLQNWPEKTHQENEDGDAPVPTRRKLQGGVFGQFNAGQYVQENLGVTIMRPGPGPDSYASDSAQPSPSAEEAYADGWLAYHEDVEPEDNPYRTGELQDAWTYGYEDAQEQVIEDEDNSSVA